MAKIIYTRKNSIRAVNDPKRVFHFSVTNNICNYGSRSYLPNQCAGWQTTSRRYQVLEKFK